MSKIEFVNDPQYIKKQYENADNLNVRIRLHEQFSANKQGWQSWLFERIAIPAGARLLELGCGTGNLWLENLERVPQDVEIILSDFSEGMLAQAQAALAKAVPRFAFQVIDAQDIPFEDDSFDVVIANHMLYHIPDRPKALSGIRRVLKPEGRFYAATIGKTHMRELHQLMSRFDAQLGAWGQSAAEAFCLENGAEQIKACFAQVTLHRYPDSLRVTDADMLLAYILSGRLTLNEVQQAALVDFVQQEVAASPQGFFITKDSGLFEAAGTAF
jgi:ubiquinone/menaquinone biosynthesis C-methylase UbiE